MKECLPILSYYHLSECFLEMVSLDFSEFWHGARNPYEVVHDDLILWETFFCPKYLGNGPKIGLFEFNEKFIISFHRICSVMKFFVICCVPKQILFWGKILFLRYGQNALSQSDCRIFKSTISLEQIDEIQSHF